MNKSEKLYGSHWKDNIFTYIYIVGKYLRDRCSLSC